MPLEGQLSWGSLAGKTREPWVVRGPEGLVEPPQNGIRVALLLEGARAARPEKELCCRVSDTAAQEGEGWALLCRLPLPGAGDAC